VSNGERLTTGLSVCLVGLLLAGGAVALGDHSADHPGAGWKAGTTGRSPVAARAAVATEPAWAQTPVWSKILPDTNGPVAESSPTVATLDDDGPSVVVGDRSGEVYALHLSDGSAVAGWPVHTGAPVDSTPSVSPSGNGLDSVFVGAGNAAQPLSGGYEGFGPGGSTLWDTAVTNPVGDDAPASGVQASLTVGDLQGGTDVVAGSLGQETYALDAGTGAPLDGWPFFNSDSTFSTAALADLYGTGRTEIVEGGDQTAGYALGQTYAQGGHVRILNATGGLICQAPTTEVVDSSPAVGGFLAGGATGIVDGTGSFFPGASDSDTVKAYDTDCHLVWSVTLDGSSYSSPALADVTGDGTLDVVEGADTGSAGSVTALDGTDGQVLWTVPAAGRVIGSVTTADLSGAGFQDVLVPTTAGVEILDGRSGQEVATLNATSGVTNGVVGFQNSPLVTDDPGGDIGITVAGYTGLNQGVIEHYEIPGSDGATVDESGSWPMFHHDPQLTGDAGSTTPAGAVAACQVPAAADGGYDLVASDGGIFSFGGQPFCGSTGGTRLNAPIVGMAMAPDTGGYWLVAADGGVFAYGGAGYFGSMGGQPLNKPIVGLAATPDGRGYWLVAADGGIFAFGDARFYGSTGSLTLNAPVVGISVNPDGLGYRLVAADGGIFTFGDAAYAGSTGGEKLNQPIVGIAADQATGGYWLVASDGGIFAFGAPFLGSAGATPLNAPVVGIQAAINGDGYRLVASDGGIFSYGDATFAGSTGALVLNRPMVGLAGF
jgi:hypothetical protein